MSLLEDVFLEDEANEAQELERIIEGDEFDESPRARSDSDNNSEREDEAEEEKKRVDPSSTKTRATRVIKNPRFILNPARLTGPRGIQVIPEHFKDFKFRAKGHEKEDLDLVLKKLEHWAYRLYPKFKFEDCLKKIETLGKKRPVMVHLHKIRTDQYMSEETVVQRDSSDEDAPQETPPEDEFDRLLQQQIELARSTPAPSTVKKRMDSAVIEKGVTLPKAASSPSISEEQRERILKSRKLAEERRLARLKNATNYVNTTQNSTDITNTHSETNNDAHKILTENENNEVNNEQASNENKINNDHSKDNDYSFQNDNSEKSSSSNKASNIDSNNKKIRLNIGESDEESNIAKVKKYRASVISSSDEEGDIIINESIRVDIHYDLNRDLVPRSIKLGLENEGNINNDDFIEINEKSTNDVENDETTNQETSVYYSHDGKESITSTNDLKRKQDNDNNCEIDDNSDSSNKNINIDKENDLEVHVTDNTITAVSVITDNVFGSDEKSKTGNVENFEVGKDFMDVLPNKGSTNGPVVTDGNSDDVLMDVDFDEDF